MSEFSPNPFSPETVPETGVEPEHPLTDAEAAFFVKTMGSAIAGSTIELVQE